MSYCLKKKERVSDGVRRIAAEEIHAVISELHSVPLHPENIHEARRHLKKIRALLRLVRKQFPSAAFKKENQTFRAAGKTLAPIRDARVISRALASLKNSNGKTSPGFRFLTSALQKDCNRRSVGKADLTKITRLLRAALNRIKNWPLTKLDDNKVQGGLERSFRRCKKAYCESIESERSEAFHEWRRRVKDLEYHLCLFEMAWRKKTKRVWKKTKRLDDLLGEDHDLVLLSERLRSFQFKSRQLQGDHQEIVSAICKKRAKLQQRAVKIGENLFKKRPAIFIRQNVRL